MMSTMFVRLMNAGFAGLRAEMIAKSNASTTSSITSTVWNARVKLLASA